MAGESLVVTQRTFWRLAARPAPPGVRPARGCPANRETPSTRVSRARVRIRRTVRPEVAAVIREARTAQARVTHVLNVYAQPDRAGGASLVGEAYAAAAARGDLRILRDALTDAVETYIAISRRIDTVIAPAPTRALPGTAEKVETMRQRHERDEDLHNHRDARREG